MKKESGSQVPLIHYDNSYIPALNIVTFNNCVLTELKI